VRSLLSDARTFRCLEVNPVPPPRGDRLNIRVEDDGSGFSDTQSILQLHVRADEQVPGHGAGLAVVTAEWGRAQVDIVLPAA
jgi:two-component system, OmpR family, sensor histidine kinase PhoQ